MVIFDGDNRGNHRTSQTLVAFIKERKGQIDFMLVNLVLLELVYWGNERDKSDFIQIIEPWLIDR